MRSLQVKLESGEIDKAVTAVENWDTTKRVVHQAVVDAPFNKVSFSCYENLKRAGNAAIRELQDRIRQLENNEPDPPLPF